MPVFCPITTDLLNACGDDYPMAGVGNIYIAPVRAVDLSAVVYSGTSHEVTVLGLTGGGEFAKIEGKVSTKDLAAENAKDGGGNVFNITANAVIANLDASKSFILEQYGNQKLVIVVELYELGTGGNRKSMILGLDKKMGIDAGANFAFNNTAEAEQGGVNGYNATITGVQGESPRFFAGALLTTGAVTVNLG